MSACLCVRRNGFPFFLLLGVFISLLLHFHFVCFFFLMFEIMNNVMNERDLHIIFHVDVVRLLHLQIIYLSVYGRKKGSIAGMKQRSSILSIVFKEFCCTAFALLFYTVVSVRYRSFC